MKNIFVFFLRYYIFWILVFIFFRILFLLSLIPYEGSINTSEIFYSLLAGYRLDISTATYFVAIPFIITALRIISYNKILPGILMWYNAIIIMLVVVLSLSNIILYKHWGTLLNSRGLAYVAQPKEMLASVSTMELFLILGVIFIVFFFINWFYKKFVQWNFEKITGVEKKRWLALLIILPLLVIGLRGGVQLIPVNESAATFSSSRMLNQVAVNNIWYLGHNVSQTGLSQKNPYNWMKPEVASAIANKLLNKNSANAFPIFNVTKKPNVVIVLLESWTADIIEPLGGIKGVTPVFNELCKDGLLFTSVYSSGFRTDQALISVLSGFPSQPNNSIIRFPDKTIHLPSITREFKNAGYTTSFYYGGETGFANMNTYLVSSGFENITSIREFESNKLNSKWGAHDEFVLLKQADDLNKSSSPFFSTLLTLSTHEPFEVPVSTPFNGKQEAEQFKKAAWYCDYSLGKYFEKIKNEQWFSNTIFILVADHGHSQPLKRDFADPAIRKIPLLIWSPLLKPELRGTQNNFLSAQHDIAATLLSSLDMPHNKFKWSNNILDSTRTNFAYLSLDMAVSWLQDSSLTLIPLEAGWPGFNKPDPAQINGKGYLQHLYATFLAY